ncbi:MAG: WecB/TagA/CpsF family glycosyltransferase, partial [Pseudomonadota bacterium]
MNSVQSPSPIASPIKMKTIIEPRITTNVLSAPIDVLSWNTALERISSWAEENKSRYVCICNAHSCVTAGQDPEFSAAVQNADMATPDGAPVAWMLRKLGHIDQQRINGPDLMWKYCTLAAYRNQSIYLYGSSEETLATLQKTLSKHFPSLKIAGAYSPPFRALTQEEDEKIIRDINASGAGTVWVSLGCPKQEKWMAAHRDR